MIRYDIISFFVHNDLILHHDIMYSIVYFDIQYDNKI